MLQRKDGGLERWCKHIWFCSTWRTVLREDWVRGWMVMNWSSTPASASLSRLPTGTDQVRGVDHVNKIPQRDVMQVEGVGAGMWSYDFSKAVRYFVKALQWLQSKKKKKFFAGLLLKFFKNISPGMTSENFPNLLLSFHFALTSQPFIRFQEFLDWKPALPCSLFLSLIVPWKWIIFSIPVWGCVSDQEDVTRMQPRRSLQGGDGANVCLIVWSAFKLTQVLLKVDEQQTTSTLLLGFL